MTGHRNHATTMMALGIVGSLLIACKKSEDGDSSSSSASSTGGARPTSTSTDATQGSDPGASASTGASGGICQGPEHEAFFNALCPFTYPDCTPPLPPEDWATYCPDSGFGPVGSGPCGCTPKAMACATGPDTSSVLCCCPLEDIDLDPSSGSPPATSASD